MIAGWTLLALLASAPALPEAGPLAQCARGPTTSLHRRFEAAPFPPRHDQRLGRTTLELRAVPGGALLRTERWDGRWSCLGTTPSARGYLLGGVLQRGAWLPLASVVHLPEGGGPATPSSFDRAGYVALAALVSPAGQYLAFVGGRGVTDGLHVLDVGRDEVRKVGPAPAPPPDAALRATCGDQALEWGSCWADGLVELEPGVLRYVSERLLEASYGKDGPAGRARARTVRRFTLGP
jgi:hypothetical protein